MSRYGKAISKWEITIGEADLVLHPNMNDNDNFRNAIMGNERATNMSRIKSFEKWLFQLVKHEYPPENEEEESDLREQINFNAIKLFEKTMIDFKYSTEEEIKKANSEELSQLKKEIGAN